MKRQVNRAPAAAALALLTLAVSASARPASTESGGRAGRSSSAAIVRVVYPTGDFPADTENVQAAANLGGTVLLKSTSMAGIPTAFNFGEFAPEQSACGRQVFLERDVRLLGERVGPVRTIIKGGTRPIAVGLIPSCVEYVISPFTPRVLIAGIDFEQPEQAAIDVYKASSVEIEDTRISNVVTVFGIATGINIFGDFASPTSVVIRNNRIRFAAPDAGWSHAIVLADLAADVSVLQNVIAVTQSFSGILVVRQSGGTVRINDNYVTPNREAPGVAGGTGIYVFESSDDTSRPARRYQIVGNRLVNQSGGIGLVCFAGSIDGAVIDGNHITTSGAIGLDEGIYLGGNVSNARVSGNRIEGEGAYGIDVFSTQSGGTGQAAESNAFVGNDMRRFNAGIAHVFLDTHTMNNTAVVGESDIVVDLGVGNRILRRPWRRH
jgi:hypothetical protein